MEFKIYVVKFSDGSYYSNSTQKCYKKENAERMTWNNAEKIRDKSIRNGLRDTVIEPA